MLLLGRSALWVDAMVDEIRKSYEDDVGCEREEVPAHYWVMVLFPRDTPRRVAGETNRSPSFFLHMHA